MKRLLMIIATVLISLSLFTPSVAQQKNNAPGISFSRSPYSVGERLTYNVSFSNFNTAAHVELLVVGRGSFYNREGLQLRAHVETTGIVSAALYSINNDYTTYVDPASGLPFRSQQVRREAGRTSDTSSEYNQAAGAAAIPAKLRTGEAPGTYDFLSALYHLRALPLAQGASYYFSVRNEAALYDVELKVMGRELIKSNVGSFNTIVTQVRARNNSQANNYRVRIYFSDDERHVPVLITARHPAGEIRAELASSELPDATPPLVAAAPTPDLAVRPQPGRLTPTVTSPLTVPIIPTPNSSRDPATTTTTAPGSSLPPGLPFKVGEQLNFNVFLASIAQPVGTASFQVRARSKYFGRDGLLLAVKAQTINTAQIAFNANDQINSYVDPTTLLPFRTELVLQEGSRRVNQTLTIDQDRGNALTVNGTRIEIPVGTHDLISVMYAMRSFNLTPPRRNAVSLLVNNRPLTLFISSLGRETIELGGQTIPAVQISLTTDDPQSDKYSFRAWVSDDRRRLPLRITAVTQLGAVRADLAIIPVTQQ